MLFNQDMDSSNPGTVKFKLVGISSNVTGDNADEKLAIHGPLTESVIFSRLRLMTALGS